MSTIGKILEDYGQKLVDEIRNNIETEKLFASKNLKQSVDFNVKILGDEYVLTIGILPDKGADQYAFYVEHGRRGGKRPPIKAMEDYITEKGIKLPKSYIAKWKLKSGETRQKERPFKNSLAARKTLAFLIARKIGEKGTIKRFGYRGSKFFSDPTDDQKMLNEIKPLLAKALAKDITIQINGND